MGIKVEDWLDWQIEEFRKHPHDACIPWPFASTDFGHGHFARNGTTIGAHRAAYEKYHGRPLKGIGRHTCDTPNCINPLHIIDGSYQDNSLDMFNRERHLGKSRWQLSNQDVLDILDLLADGVRQVDIAERYGITQPMVSHIKTGRAWSHLTWHHPSRPEEE